MEASVHLSDNRDNENVCITIDEQAKVVHHVLDDASQVQQLHHIPCVGVRFYDIVTPPDHYEFLLHYPTRIHQAALPHGVRAPTWSFDSYGNFYSKKCLKLFILDNLRVSQPSSCTNCSKLHYCPYLKNIMADSIESSLSLSASQ